MQSADSKDLRAASSQRPSSQRYSGSGRPRNAPTSPNPDPQSPHIQYQEPDPRQRFDAAYPSSTAQAQQASQSTDPRSRPRDSATVHHPPHVTRDYSNLRQEFSAAEPGVESQQNNRRYPDQPAASDPPAQSYPPIAYYQTSTYEPEQRFSRSSTVQDMQSSSQSDAQRPTRSASRGQAAQADLQRLSTTSTTAAKPPVVNDSVDPAPIKDPSDEPIDIEVFRALMGIPQEHGTPLALDSTRRAAAGDEPVTPKTPYEKTSPAQVVPQAISPPAKVKQPRSWRRYLLNILTFGLRREERDEEFYTSIYYSILQQQRINQRLYILYDLLTYICMIAQLIIAAVLIIIGALKGDYHIPVAVLGGVIAIINGVLALVKGQGFPNRFIQYLDSLRRVREDIEFTERELRAKRRIVTYGEIIALKDAYDQVRKDEGMNRPDFWSTGLDPKVGGGNVGKSSFPSKQSSQSKSAAAMV
ncbi:hypothetical protein NA57DRAFT_72919 [Rhizodiscina lignyota]|uniref:SMODS and SLOG-associating 2TM effector domain-containing protein n=1 Tax=Rhizodiscina lignyota TaxID=1504668 RepID=A0A9P4IN46_9PEZI|nr:hypothetical protein NA57DRAFT_72919 [Rhizodiscina lignyota]